MKTLLIAGLSLTAAALQLVQRDSPNVVGFPIQKRADNSLFERSERIRRQIAHHRSRRHRHRRRNGTVAAKAVNAETLYFVNASLGTPPQKLFLHLDTGSSDLWVNSYNSNLCSGAGSARCELSGTYDANASSTYSYLNSDFNITYVDNSGASGDFANDTLRFGGVTLPQQQFGIGYTSTTNQGILGIGYEAHEEQVTLHDQAPYSNVPASLASQGYINSNAYSLWLNDLDANSGQVLFGGVNTAYFDGPLYTMPVVKENGIYQEFIVALSALGQNGNMGSITSGQQLAVLLDSGSSLTYLPDDITQNIWAAFNAAYNADTGAAYINCDLASQQGSIDFTFNDDPNTTISVSLSELVVPYSETNGQVTQCIFGITNTSVDTTPVLGDTFLRSAYVVYDLDANEVSIAPTVFNSTKPNQILEISSSSPVPSATMIPSPIASVTGIAPGVSAAAPRACVTPPPQLKWGALAVAGVGALAVL